MEPADPLDAVSAKFSKPRCAGTAMKLNPATRLRCAQTLFPPKAVSPFLCLLRFPVDSGIRASVQEAATGALLGLPPVCCSV